MKVVIDNNLPFSLAQLLRGKQIEALHIVEVGLAHASDPAITQAFVDQQIVFISRDNDFWVTHPSHRAVIWLAMHNPTLAEIKGPIFRALSQVIPTLQSGQRVLLARDQIRLYEES